MTKKKPPIPSIINNRADVAARITKAGTSTEKQSEINLDQSNIVASTSSIHEKISSNDEILNLFPDVELSIQILVGAILAPNDLMNYRLTYNMDDIDVPNNINTQILNTIRSHIDKNYNLENKLSTILREALFTKGAYCEALIPDTNIDILKKQLDTKLSVESAIDGMVINDYLSNESDINLSIESEYHGRTIDSNISFTEDELGISYTEDLNILRVSNLYIESLSTEREYSPKYKKATLVSALTKNKKKTSSFTVFEDSSSGAPACVKFPVESVLPIHMASDTSKHIGYIVLLDESGQPVIKGKNFGSFEKANGFFKDSGATDIKSGIIDKVSKALNTKLSKTVPINGISSIYTRALASSINKRVTSGKLGNTVSIPEYSDIYSTIMTRTLKNLKTRLLYIPISNMSYIAFEYRDNGTGLSLLEKSVMLFSIRATNLFTRIMANVKNSITTTKITANLDETDPDPERTREAIINQAMKTERTKYPIGVMNVKDMVDWMHNIGYRFNFKHPKFPDIEIDVSEDTRSMAVPDTDFDEMIQEHITMSFGLKQDMIKAGYEADFATTVVANNALFAKRIMDYQRKTNPQLGHYVRNVLRNDGILKEKLLDLITSNIRPIKSMIMKGLTKEIISEYKEQLDDNTELVEYVYSLYVNDLIVTLPPVETSREEGTLDGLDAFVNMLETYLPMIISSDSLPSELVGDISDKMEDIMAAIKTVMIKNWIDNRNFMPELTKFLTLDNEGKPKYDILSEYTEFTSVLSKAIIPHIKKMKKESDSNNAKIEKAEADNESTSDTGDDTATPEDDTSSDDTTSDDTTSEDDSIDSNDTSSVEEDV